MKKVALGAILVAALATGGCVSPLVHPSAPTLQKKVSNTADIRQLAGNAAQRFALRLKIADKPVIYVAPGPADMTFAEEFKHDLEEALMAKGYTISQSAVGAEVLNFAVQPYLYGPDHQKHLMEYATFWTTWANIGYQISQMNHAVGTQFAVAGVLGPIWDVMAAMDQTTPAEVNIRLSVLDASRVYYSDSLSFYVPPGDLPFYMTAMPSAAPQMLAGDQPLPVVRLPVRAGY